MRRPGWRGAGSFNGLRPTRSAICLAETLDGGTTRIAYDQVSCPVLVVSGSEDLAVSTATARADVRPSER